MLVETFEECCPSSFCTLKYNLLDCIAKVVGKLEVLAVLDSRLYGHFIVQVK